MACNAYVCIFDACFSSREQHGESFSWAGLKKNRSPDLSCVSTHYFIFALGNLDVHSLGDVKPFFSLKGLRYIWSNGGQHGPLVSKGLTFPWQPITARLHTGSGYSEMRLHSGSVVCRILQRRNQQVEVSCFETYSNTCAHCDVHWVGVCVLYYSKQSFVHV